jgi:phosphatidylserine/phosphatidylglycerophosphate/cardiolipin synthase-like enzyme
MSDDFQVKGSNPLARFTLTVHRGDGMALLAMNWRAGRPPRSFVGFAIEYREPGGSTFFALNNRLGFPGRDSSDAASLSTLRSPIQKFRWVHFPRNADLGGAFTYRVTPVFMAPNDALSLGEPQQVDIALRRETHPGQLNIAYTRGMVSSQAFVDRYASVAPISTLLPARAHDGLRFKPTHPQAAAALRWMGFEARSVLLDLLDEAIADPAAQVRVIAYDLNEPAVLSRLERLKTRLKVLIDDDGPHGEPDAAEAQAEARLVASAGRANVQRQHQGKLQHNKLIVVDGPVARGALCGSTNFSWRGLYVQANNALVLRGAAPVALFRAAFDAYWAHPGAAASGATPATDWTDLGLPGIDAKISFAPHPRPRAKLAAVAADVATTRSSLFYSLAFLYQTRGAMRDAIRELTASPTRFVYGVSDRKVGGIDLQKPDGNIAPVFPAALTGDVPEPFRSEPTGGGGNRMHHKFLVIDFDRPTARVYTGSYNFSTTADTKNGENLLCIRDRRIAVSYMIEALRIVDHCHFRVAQQQANRARQRLELRKPPRAPGELPWWDEDYTDPRKARDRKLFA